MQDNVLVIGPSWVGDMVMAQVLFKLLKKKNPQQPIDVMAPDWSAPILARMKEVRHHISMPIGHGRLALKLRHSLAKNLRHQYSKSYVLPNSFKSALIPLWAKVPKRVGFTGEMRYGLLNDVRRLDKSKLPLMIQRFAHLAFDSQESLPKDLPRPELTIEPGALPALLQDKGLSQDKPVIGLCPGAEFGPSKQWGIESYAQTANHFLDKGFAVWVFGSQNDFKTAKAIDDRCQNRTENLAGKTTLSEACDILSTVEAVVTNDSGLMHIAAALDKPLVALYGSTDPSFTPPLASKRFIYQTDVSCSPCFERSCPLKHHQCMKSLKADRVIQQLEDWLL